MRRLTEAQKRELSNLVEVGFVEHASSFGRSQSNRPRWALVEAGFAQFGFGPRDSRLKIQGFTPTPAGREALRKEGGE